MLEFVKMSRRERIMQRNIVENSSELFDWKVLGDYYAKAHDLALERMVGAKKKKAV
jgi:glycogen(starch) synthase